MLHLGWLRYFEVVLEERQYQKTKSGDPVDLFIIFTFVNIRSWSLRAEIAPNNFLA